MVIQQNAFATLSQLVLLFFLYSLAGWLIEVTLKYIQFHRFINRGFFTGPICPIYGSGALLITLAGIVFSRASDSDRDQLSDVLPALWDGRVFDELPDGEALPCPLVALQPETHERARAGLDRESDSLRHGRDSDPASA